MQDLTPPLLRNREPVFADPRLGRIVVQSMRHHHETGQIRSLAFVVMPDHLHWLVELQGARTLDSLMRRFKGYTALEVNRARTTSDVKLWQPGYHDHALRREEKVKSVARYIIANPLRAGLVENIGDYPLWDAIWL